MLRINPLRRRRLADLDLERLVEEAVGCERAARVLAEAASADLYRLVPTTPEEMRGRVVGLRRDIHNGRLSALEAVEDLPLELPASVGRWAANDRRRRSCHARLRQAYDGALGRERDRLRRDLEHRDFLVTLAQSASGVYDAAVRYHDHPVATAEDRKAERALVQYLTRAMVRTSPYGRFTAVGLGAPDRSGAPLASLTPATARPHVEIDRALFDHVAGGLVPTAGDGLVAVAPTARVGDGQVTFFQVGHDNMRRLSAPLNPQTKALVDLLELGPRRRHEVATALAQRLGLDPHDADRLVGVALGLGLLVTAWRGDEFVADPVGQALRDLAAAGSDLVPPALHQLRVGIDRLGDDSPDGSADERIAAVRGVVVAGEELSRRARRPARLAVNEDFVLDPLVVDPGSHEAALDDLAAVTELLSTFDRMHVVRSLIASLLAARFGTGCRVPLVEHAEWLVNAMYRGERSLAEHPDALRRELPLDLPLLLKVRQEIEAAWRHDAAAASRRGATEVCWSRGQVAALLAGLPERFGAGAASYGVVVQAHGDGLILNDAYAGHGPMFSRFLHADHLRGGDATARLRRRLHDLHGPGYRLLEDRAWHGLSINAHPSVLDEALDPAGWGRLQLCHDPDTDAVSILDGEGAPAKVLALGAQLPELLPYPARLATWLCSSGRVVLDLPDRRGPLGEAGDTAATVAWPRLRVERVVVSRRRWYPGTDFPARASARDDVDYLLALTQWRARHDVPAEVMLKAVFDGPVMWDSLKASSSREQFFELRQRSKPQYVDLSSALMTRVLPRLQERRPGGFVEEALPGLGGGGHASEWMVEMARAPGAARFSWRPVAPGSGTPEE
jgi:hypothetical protein